MENKVDKKAELIENVQTSVGKLFKGEKVTVMTQENGTYCNATCTAEVVLTEACDDGDVQNETCGDGEIQTIFGDYCNSTCTATIVFPAPEYCDYDTFTNDCNDAIYGWLTEADVGTGNFCREGICNSKILLCL